MFPEAKSFYITRKCFLIMYAFGDGAGIHPSKYIKPYITRYWSILI